MALRIACSSMIVALTVMIVACSFTGTCTGKRGCLVLGAFDAAAIRLGARLVPGAGVEPAWPCGRGILSPLRIPVSPPGPVAIVPQRDGVRVVPGADARGVRARAAARGH